MPTKAKGADGPKKKQGPRLQERPFNDKPLQKPPMDDATAAIWDETVAAMPDGHFKAGDMRALQGYCVAVAGWLFLLGEIEANMSRLEGRETEESRLERALRAELTGTAKMLGIMTPTERRMQEERPAGALKLLDAHRVKAS